jgi:mono/diheme cytochrome c family protein
MKFVHMPTLAVALALVLSACAGGGETSERSDEIGGTPDTGGPSARTLAMAESSPGTEAAELRGAADALSTDYPQPTTGSEAASESAAEENPPSADAAEDDGSVYSGVFSFAQASRGEEVQQRECSACHSPAEWSQGRILTNFAGASAFDMLDHIRMTMPMDGPGRLSMEEYTDVVAYLFHLNGLPAGPEDLPADESRLREIRIEYRR